MINAYHGDKKVAFPSLNGNIQIDLIVGLAVAFCCFTYTGGCDQPGFLYEGKYYYHVVGKGLFSYSPNEH